MAEIRICSCLIFLTYFTRSWRIVILFGEVYQIVEKIKLRNPFTTSSHRKACNCPNPLLPTHCWSFCTLGSAPVNIRLPIIPSILDQLVRVVDCKATTLQRHASPKFPLRVKT